MGGEEWPGSTGLVWFTFCHIVNFGNPNNGMHINIRADQSVFKHHNVCSHLQNKAKKMVNVVDYKRWK